MMILKKLLILAIQKWKIIRCIKINRERKIIYHDIKKKKIDGEIQNKIYNILHI